MAILQLLVVVPKAENQNNTEMASLNIHSTRHRGTIMVDTSVG